MYLANSPEVYDKFVDDDLIQSMNEELQTLYDQADYMGYWPSHFDDLAKEIQIKYKTIQDERIDELLLS